MRFKLLIALVIVAALAAAFAPIDSALIERAYSTVVYPRIQGVVTPISNVVPFALFDVLTVLVVVVLILDGSVAIWRAKTDRSFRPIGSLLFALAGLAAFVYLLFLVMWGLNYRRVPMAERLEMAAGPPTTEQVMQLGFDAIKRMNALHEQAHRLGWEADPRFDMQLTTAYAFVQQRLVGAARATPGRLKGSIYGPYFRWTTVDGMINPFALEVLANPDLLPFERTFVAAHEWAHLAGFANEAEANFVGWLTCIRAGVPAQYSGWLNLYWQIGVEVSPEGRKQLWDAVAEGPRRDIQAITDRLQRGQLQFLRNASWRVYDGYLRANRVEEGVRSYGQVISLVLQTRFEDGWVPVRRTSEPAGALSR